MIIGNPFELLRQDIAIPGADDHHRVKTKDTPGARISPPAASTPTRRPGVCECCGFISGMARQLGLRHARGQFYDGPSTTVPHRSTAEIDTQRSWT
jgi:hypothetical protein